MTGSSHDAQPHDAQPRDPRLQLFGQGRRGDTAPGSAWLAAQASDVSEPDVLGQATDDELLGIGRAWKALECATRRCCFRMEVEDPHRLAVAAAG